MILKKIENLLLLVLLFLLPWQTRYIWQYGELGGGAWEFGTFSIYGIEILLWLIILLFFFRNLCDKKLRTEFLAKKKLLFFPIIFLGLMGTSLAFSENFWVSYQYVFRWLGAMALALIFSTESKLTSVIPAASGNPDNSTGHWIPNQVGKDKKLFALWLGGVVQGILAVYQFLNQSVFGSKWLGMAAQEAMQGGASVVEFADQRWLRAYGSFGSPNSLGIYLAVLLVLGIILYLKTERPLFKIFITVGQLIILSGLLFSFSRGAWLSAIVGIVGLTLVIFFKQKDWRVFFVKQVVFILVLAGFWVGIFFPIFSARFNLQNRLEVRSVRERQSQYKEALYFVKQNPLFGVGPGVFTFVLAQKYLEIKFWQLQPVHNIYVLSVAEFGVLFSLFLGLIILRLIIKVFKNNLVFLPVPATLLVAGMFDHWLFSMFSGLLLWWVIWGLNLRKTDPLPR